MRILPLFDAYVQDPPSRRVVAIHLNYLMLPYTLYFPAVTVGKKIGKQPNM